MGQRIVSVDRETPLLLAPTIQEWVAENDMARLIVEAVGLLEESQLAYNWRGSGSAQYPPRMMLALLIYCYAHGVLSSRRIERATYRDVAVRYITADHHPDHDTIAKFRRENGELIGECFTRVLVLAREMGVLRVGDVAIDGSKITASASRRKVRCKSDLELEVEVLERKVGALMEQAAAMDAREAQTGDGTALPKALSEAKARQAKLREALARLEHDHGQRVARREEERAGFDRSGPGEPPRALPPQASGQDCTNLSEPQARLLPTKTGGYEPAYNVQIGVQAVPGAALIVAAAVSTQGNDRRQLETMVNQVVAQHPQTGRVLVDSGYDNAAQIYRVEQTHGVVVYCPPETSRKSTGSNRNSRARKRTMHFREGMRACLRSDFGQKSHTLRASTVEPVFGWIKNTLGFRRFGLRGHAGVNLEWNLVALAHNLSILHRFQSRRAAV